MGRNFDNIVYKNRSNAYASHDLANVANAVKLLCQWIQSKDLYPSDCVP